MNTLSKVLLFLVFVMAFLVVGFMTYTFAARTNNQLTAEQYRNELEITRKNNLALTETNTALLAQLSTAKSDLEAKRLELAEKQLLWDATEQQLKRSLKDSEDRGKSAETLLEGALTAKERLQKEVEHLKSVVEDREKRLVALHTKYKDSTDLNISLDRDLKFSQERNSSLLSRVQELEKHVAELISGKASDVASALPKDPNTPNPPAKFVKGQIERVDSQDKTLVRVSLGTDHGVKANNTLEVFRLSPKTEYIGMIRIEDAHHHTSVARLVRTPGVPMREIREGDVVSSTLSPR